MYYIYHKLFKLKNKLLKEFFEKNNFFRAKLHFLASNHYKVLAKINNQKGWFIIDTGASITFISDKLVNKFNLKIDQTKGDAQGAGKEKIKTQISKKNILQVGIKKFNNYTIGIIDLDPINSAFKLANLDEVDGVIGADLLKRGNAIIDYQKNYIYLK